MDHVIFEILIIFLLLVINGIFAMSEMAIVAARKVRLQKETARGNRKARTALDLASSPNQFLSTIQIGITLIGILAGAFGGATISNRLAVVLSHIPVLAPYRDLISVGVVVLLITYCSLVIGELVPKRVALNNAEGISIIVAGPMKTISIIASPFVHLLSISTDIAVRFLQKLGIRPSHEPPVTEEEVKMLIQQGTQLGVFEEAEQDMIEGVLRLGARRAGSFMTPRSQIAWIDPTDPPETIGQDIMSSPHSVFPVAEGDVENVKGMVHTKDMLVQCLQGRPLEVNALLQEPLFVPETMPALKLLELFKEKGTYVALIVNEYGGIEGLVTHNDLLEGIAGDLALAGTESEPKAVQRDDGSLLVDGLLHIDRLKEFLDIDVLPGEEESQYHTMGGFVVHQLGRIPKTGQSFLWHGFRFEVVDMDWPRVDKVLVTSTPELDKTSPTE
ncbi:MAG: HlyC/CorC family transporter [Desulfobacteraceae bacterium]|nr:MAG: HlyC/CorC family transporter [Desulfobacteraceae bacterium]